MKRDNTTNMYVCVLQNYDLEQKIELELKMRDGTKKLLSACRELNQIIEASKSLLTSDIRLGELRAELAKRKNSKTK